MTPKTKNILLVTAFLLFLAIAYSFAFSKTLALKKRVDVLKIKSKSVVNPINIERNLETRELYVDSILRLNNMKSNSVQNNLLEFLNSKSELNEFTILEFKEPHTFSESGTSITSYRFTLGGSYNKIEKVLYGLEQKANFGKITHVHFEKKRNYKSRNDYLECFVLVESLVSE